MSDSVFDPKPMGPLTGLQRGSATGPAPKVDSLQPAGAVKKIVHYKDILKCDHGGKVNLDPTEERNTEIQSDLRIVTDKDLLEKVTISGCSLGCTKIIAINTGLAKDVELKDGAIPVLQNLIAISDKGCTVKWIAFEIDFNAATNWLHSHAKPNYTGQCAAHVRQGLNAGLPSSLQIPGLSTYNMDAATWGPVLESHGFQPAGTGTVSGDGSFSNPQTGDIVVFDTVPGHPDGHTAMWDGNHWVSDTQQQHAWSNNDPKGGAYKGGRFTIYRSAGLQAHAGPK